MDPGRLRNFVDWKKHESSLTTQEVKDIFQSLVAVVNYVHDKRYIIRNLLPDNIMLRKDGDKYMAKLTDLSYVVPFGSNENLADHPLFDWGDVPFTSPEALLGPSYNQSTDIWSLGVVLYVMLTHHLPFYHEDDKTLVHTIKVLAIVIDYLTFSYAYQHYLPIQMAAYSYDINSPVDENARELVAQLIRADPNDRLSTKEILRNPWISSRHKDQI